MKKKDNLSQKDKEDWKNFLEDTSRIPDKDKTNQLRKRNETFRFDLHGLTLNEANKKVRDIISHKDLKISGNKFRLGRGADQEIHLPHARVALEHAILEIGNNETLTLTATERHSFIHNNVTTTVAQLSEEDLIQIGGFTITPKYGSDGIVVLEI